MSHNVVYLDYQATTPVDQRVLDAMLPFLTQQYANPSSPHQPGRRAASALRAARRQVKISLGAEHDTEIVFTSGATEANHLAILGTATANPRPDADHIITTPIEHQSVLATCDHLSRAGYSVTTVPVDHHGRVNPADVAVAITPHTVLVSVMYANNEIGTIQPIADIAAITRRHNVLLHTDAAQAIGALDIDVNRLGVDLLTISAHKIYGPKGIGALYIRRGTPIRPQYAGSQEHGFRAGTINLPGTIALAEALRILATEREHETPRIAQLRDSLADRLLAALPHAHINGSPEHRLPGNLSLTIPGIDAADLIDALPDLAISNGSACASGHAKPSHVLTAIGLPDSDARATIRLSLGRETRESDIEHAAHRIGSSVATTPPPG
ncbi:MULTISPECIES: cysteine desulfurase family protein [unclassified Micromonospora]|uniref:cysteine desulfurase family protein n=1 Tax=unclassified Micromonospora TaxID=2617518 RepID=UPI00363CA033